LERWDAPRSYLSVELLRLEQGPHYHLYAYKLEDLVSPGQQNLDQSRVTIRYNVTFFRVGYHRSQPFLVLTTETVRVIWILFRLVAYARASDPGDADTLVHSTYEYGRLLETKLVHQGRWTVVSEDGEI
jgi:hypothetical protein